MMRMTGLLLAAGAVAALGFRSGKVGSVGNTNETRAPVVVTVAVTGCGQSDVSIRINPWQAHIAPGDSLSWNHSGADSVMISPVTQGWPFPGASPRAARGAQARAGALARGRARAGQRFSYEIVMYCAGRVIKIDPDIVIDE
jgi:hypothetical protein